MTKKLLASNGDVFLVPLSPNEFAIGVLIRADGKGRAFGAFFGSQMAETSAIDFSQLQMNDAVLLCRFGDHGLHTKRWPIIGSIPNWSEQTWPLPKFARRHDNPQLRYVTEYDDSLALRAEEILPAAETTYLPEDSQFGSGVVEVKLAKLLPLDHRVQVR